MGEITTWWSVAGSIAFWIIITGWSFWMCFTEQPIEKKWRTNDRDQRDN